VIDAELVEKKLVFMVHCLRELKKRADPTRLDEDIVHRMFVERMLQLAIQAALDVASHLVSEEHLAEPTSNADLFRALTRHGVLTSELGNELVGAAQFRNVLVHNYVDVDLAVVREVLENRLGVLADFNAAVRTFFNL
jgi:uncharacterized protein YutE (UPF0331/DUF86 family)